MIKWQDEGLIIDFRLHGETSAIVELFTREHGRVAGVVKGGAGRKNRASLQAGQLANIDYYARLDTHMGSLKIEPQKSYTSALIASPKRLAGFQAMTSLLKFGMTERDPHPRLYRHTLNWLNADDIASAYIHWEMILLSEAGFELELNACAVTGGDDDLAYVSPKTGRAISRAAAGEWADRLLPYSQLFQSNEGDFKPAAETLEHFLQHWLGQMIGKHKLPEARARFVSMI